jgi:hypothetical protein
VDAKEAYNQLLAAQDIIKKGADADAAFFDTAMKAAMATKTACKVGMVVTGAIVTGGVVAAGSLSTSAILAESAVIAINATDALIDVGVTSSTIFLGENHSITKILNITAAETAPFFAVAGLYTSDFSKIGTITKDAAEAFSYIGQSLADYMYDGKFMGVDVSSKPDGKTEVKATAVDIPFAKDGTVDADKLNNSLTQVNFPAIPTEEADLKPIGQAIDEFEKTKPDPNDVLRQIDEALAELEALLIELGKIEAMPEFEGTYSGTYNQTGGGSVLSGNATVEMLLSDKNSNTYTAKCTIQYRNLSHVYTFTAQINDGHFQSPNGTSTYKYDTGASISLNFSENGNSLNGTVTRHSVYEGKSYDYTITINTAR